MRDREPDGCYEGMAFTAMLTLATIGIFIIILIFYFTRA